MATCASPAQSRPLVALRPVDPGLARTQKLERSATTFWASDRSTGDGEQGKRHPSETSTPMPGLIDIDCHGAPAGPAVGWRGMSLELMGNEGQTAVLSGRVVPTFVTGTQIPRTQTQKPARKGLLRKWK